MLPAESQPHLAKNNLNMADSWYVANSCVDVDEMKPMSAIAIGCFIQFVMVNILVFYNSESNEPATDVDDVTSSLNPSVNENPQGKSWKKYCNCCLRCWQCIKPIKDKRWFKCVMNLYVVWQFVSIVLVLVLDILKMVDRFTLFDRTWDRYQCYAVILLTSSNAKTLITYFCVLCVLVMYEEYNEDPSMRQNISILKMCLMVFQLSLDFTK